MLKKVRVKVGLVDFEYCASLHIEHPQLNPDLVSDALQITPIKSHRAGDPRSTPAGQPSRGVYDSGYWTVDLEARDGEDVAQFLWRTVNELGPAERFLRRIVDTGGRIECFMGLFATRLCDQVVPCELLLRLGQIGIDLRLDYYDVSKGADQCREIER
jgi:hypothetical protein